MCGTGLPVIRPVAVWTSSRPHRRSSQQRSRRRLAGRSCTGMLNTTGQRGPQPVSRNSSDIDVRNIGYTVVLNRIIELPERALPESLLGFYCDGCGIFSSIDLNTGRIFLDSHPYLYYEANSLEEWLERWL